MSKITSIDTKGLDEIAKQLVSALTYTKNINGKQQIITPLIYPSGSFVGLSLEKSEKGFFISDNGSAYREAYLFDGTSSFLKEAKKVADCYGVNVESDMIFDIDIELNNLVPAAAAVANASKRTVELLAEHIRRKNISQKEEQLYQKLYSVFPDIKIHEKYKIDGNSDQWEVDAAIILNKPILFDLVTPHVISVNSTVAKYFDIKDRGQDETIRVSVPLTQKNTPHLSLLTRVSTVTDINAQKPSYEKLRNAA